MASRKPSPESLTARLLVLINAHSASREAVRRAAAAQVDAAWARVLDPYDPLAEVAFTEAAATTVRSARRRTNDLTAGYLARVLDAHDVPVPRGNPVALDQPRGIPIETEMLRVPAQYRRLIADGKGEAEARASAALRAEGLSDTDLTLAMTDASRQVMAKSPHITGYRRILHPELSTTGVCGLCIATSTKAYKVKELLPIHANCRCSIGPIIERQVDFADAFNIADLKVVYEDAGGTAGRKLKEVRYEVHLHSEIGPVLTVKGQRFRGKTDVERDTKRTP